VSILTKRLVDFNCTPESSMILLFWSPKEAQCIFQLLLRLVSQLLLKGSSKGLFCYSHSIHNLVVYLCAKFGALNPGIKEIRSGGSRAQPVPQVPTCRFTIPTIFWLSRLVAIYPRASGTIMDSSIYVSSH
jgi:hypothetical protein